MSGIEVVLVIIGIVAFALSFILPEKFGKEPESVEKTVSREEVAKLVEGEIEESRDKIKGAFDETLEYGMEKAERSLERVTNEKIQAVNDFSSTVLDEIDKNHKEVVFLYDMLNDKQENLKNTVADAEKKAKDVKQTVIDAEITAKETQEKVEAIAAFEQLEVINVDRENNHIVEKADTETNIIGMAGAGATLTEDNSSTSAAAVPSEEGDVNSELIEATAQVQELLGNSIDSSPIKKKTASKATGKKAQATKSGAKKNAKVEIPKDAPNLSFLGSDEQNRNSNDRILTLHKAGKSNMAIAKELGLGIGEVKLVIDLFEGL